jgi:transcriptional regulator with XRE-family HTH domain
MDTNNLALKLERLFEEKRKLNGKRYTPTEVLAGTQGYITRVYLWKLRNGRMSNPSLRVIQALANFFKIDPTYFFESDTTKLQQLLDQYNGLVYQIAQRSAELNPEEQHAVLLMIDSIIKSRT